MSATTDPTHKDSDIQCYEDLYRNEAVRWTFFVVLTLLILLTLLGNALVCSAMIFDKSLRTPANVFLLNMSVGDMVVAVTIIFTDYIYLIQFPTWQLGSFGNWIYNIGLVTLLIVPFLMLTAVTIDRYLCIIYPLRYVLLVTKRRVLICVLLLWIYTVVAVALIAMFAFSKQVTDNQWQFLLVNPYYVTLILCHTLLPLLVIVVLYFRIYMVARRHRRQIAALMKRFGEHGVNVRYMKSQLKATRTVFIVVVVLVLSWLPFILNESLSFVFPERLHCVYLKLGAVATYITYFNGALNPIVYALRHRRFFLVFKKILCCKKNLASARGVVAPSSG